jgi:hypothetical protein
VGRLISSSLLVCHTRWQEDFDEGLKRIIGGVRGVSAFPSLMIDAKNPSKNAAWLGLGFDLGRREYTHSSLVYGSTGEHVARANKLQDALQSASVVGKGCSDVLEALAPHCCALGA